MKRNNIYYSDIDINKKESYSFAYRYENKMDIPVTEVYDWCNKCNIICYKLGNFYYFEKENDRLQFILRFD